MLQSYKEVQQHYIQIETQTTDHTVFHIKLMNLKKHLDHEWQRVTYHT